MGLDLWHECISHVGLGMPTMSMAGCHRQAIKIRLFDHDVAKTDDSLGNVTLGASSSGEFWLAVDDATSGELLVLAVCCCVSVSHQGRVAILLDCNG